MGLPQLLKGRTDHSVGSCRYHAIAMTVNEECPFCTPPEGAIVWKSEQAYAILDRFPVSPGHSLIIPRRHCRDWFEATDSEREAILNGLDAMRGKLNAEHSPQGYNIGINVGQVAGQTVFHLHVHLIPRYEGDVPDPRGGIRHVIPGKGYDSASGPGREEQRDLPHLEALTTGSTLPDRLDPLLAHLLPCIRTADEIDILAAFLQPSGLQCVEEPLLEALRRGTRVRLLTGDYCSTTHPEALQRLLSWPDPFRAWVFECEGKSFHPKSWIFRWRDQRAVAFVGSSNLSRQALHDGVEWNQRTTTDENPAAVRRICASFEALLRHSCTKPLTADWLTAYRTRWRGNLDWAGELVLDPEDLLDDGPALVKPIPRTDEQAPPLPLPVRVTAEPDARGAPTPTSVQVEALEALQELRASGGTKALVVLATGLGKTWLSAFDSCRPQFRRVLFVAHR